MTSFRSILFSTASGAVLAVSALQAAHAAQQKNAEAAVEEVVVTGSRIVRDGYQAPTPVSVIGEADLQNLASGNVAAYLSTIPAFSGNMAPGANRANNDSNAGRSGLNLVNLRNLGVTRSLVLMDGQRFIPTLTFGSTSSYATNISMIPQQLIKRIDVVTGGASAVYGSDAVGGVTNFIIDSEFTGVKADLSAGITTYGDDENGKLDITAGFPFAGGKGHVLVSGEWYGKPELRDYRNREWARENAWCRMQNPNYTATNGQPFRLIVPDCGANSAPGGVINNGPMKGTAFGANGQPFNFQYGSIVSPSNMMTGGDYKLTSDLTMYRGASFSPGEQRQNVFTRVSYDVTDSVKATYTYMWGFTASQNRNTMQFNDLPGSTMRTDNAYLPAGIRAGFGATTNFLFSTENFDLPDIYTNHNRTIMRNSLSLDGDIDLLGDHSWKWNIYYQHGVSLTRLSLDSRYKQRYADAIDAVVGPNGVIVCRINADAVTTNDDPNCRPLNIFGTGVASEAAIRYVSANSKARQTNWQQVWSGSITGDVFDIWAGPVSLAVSLEHRRDVVHDTSSADAAAFRYQNGNFQALSGKVQVTEGALETLIPLAKNESWADSLDLQLAGRFTGYSTSGFVATYKVGATYGLGDIRLRGNVSHDIRAPNIAELFATNVSQTFTPNVFDDFTGSGAVGAYVASGVGDPNLRPEKANSFGLGAVYSPSYIPGFTASADFWQVKMSDAITSLASSAAITICAQAGLVGAACPYLTRLPAGTTLYPGVGAYAGQSFTGLNTVRTGFINAATQRDHGLDVSATYSTPVDAIISGANGQLTFKWDQTFYLEATITPGLKNTFTAYNAPYWRGVGNITWTNDPWMVGLTARAQSKWADEPANGPKMFVACGYSCLSDATFAGNVDTINFYKATGSLFLDTNISYKFNLMENVGSEAYLNVRNVLNRAPNIHATFIEPHSFVQSVSGDDSLGRVFRMGFRFKM